MHDLLFIVYAGLACFLLAISSPPHFRSLNIGAIALVAWCFMGSLGLFVNAIVWWDNVDNPSPVWCDIWTRIHLGLTTGISAGCLCINRRLSIISSAKRPSVSARERRRELWIDVAIVVAPPFWVMIIYYTVQGNRFNLSEGSGCQPAVYVSWPAILAVYVPPLLVGCISFVYGGLSIWNFTSRRLQFQSVLQTGGGLDTSRFIRLVSLSSVEMLVSVPISAWAISYVITHALSPYLDWVDTHAEFSHVQKFNASFLALAQSQTDLTNTQRWIPVFAAFLYFAFFGMQEEALASYWSVLSGAGRLAKMWTGKKGASLPPTSHTLHRLPNLGNTIGPVSPSNPIFPHRSAEDLEKGGLALTITDDGEEEQSLGYRHSKLRVAVKVERDVMEQ